jgi:hypothetical protein
VSNTIVYTSMIVDTCTLATLFSSPAEAVALTAPNSNLKWLRLAACRAYPSLRLPERTGSTTTSCTAGCKSCLTVAWVQCTQRVSWCRRELPLPQTSVPVCQAEDARVQVDLHRGDLSIKLNWPASASACADRRVQQLGARRPMCNCILGSSRLACESFWARRLDRGGGRFAGLSKWGDFIGHTRILHTAATFQTQSQCN